MYHVLLMFGILCALPAGVVVAAPTAIAQEEDDDYVSLDDENLASSIVPNVLDGSGDNEDDERNDDGAAAGDDDGDSNTQIALPITTQDQREANLAAQLGLDVDIVEDEEEEVTPTPTPTPEEDTTPPTLTVPEDITREATSEGVQVRYTVTAQDNVDGTATLDEENTLTQDDVGGDITISCDRLSGSTFPIGSTEVGCTATDEAGNTATASFTVTINPITCQGVPATRVGTPEGDVIGGSEGRDVIAALGGNDIIDGFGGFGGDDLICGDGGDDLMAGGSGDDEMFGGEGEDALLGDDGVVNNDSLDVGDDTDICISDPDPEINCELN